MDEVGAPIVVKADGLAAGKGVILAKTLDEAKSAVQDMLQGNQFGKAGSRVVIEEFLTGEEASFIVMVDGTDVLRSRHHKTIKLPMTAIKAQIQAAWEPTHRHQWLTKSVMTASCQRSFSRRSTALPLMD